MAFALLRCGEGTDDDGTTFQAYVKSRAIPLAGSMSKLSHVSEPIIEAKAATGVTLTVTIGRDLDKETRSGTVLLTAVAPESYRVIRKVEGLDLAEIDVVQFQIGDAAPVSNSWALERIDIPIAEDGDK